jgi:hypothetical protein
VPQRKNKIFIIKHHNKLHSQFVLLPVSSLLYRVTGVKTMGMADDAKTADLFSSKKKTNEK